MDEKDFTQETTGSHESKRCPYCFAELQIDADRCPACLEKVGKVMRDGRAREPINWRAYGVCIIAWVLFAWFVWFGFFRD